MHINPCPCTHKKGGVNVCIFMAYGSSNQNIHHPEDGMVVCNYCHIWSHSFAAMWLRWTWSQCIDCVIGLSDLAHHSPTRYVEVHHVTAYTTLRIPWSFCSSLKTGCVSWLLSFDEWHTVYWLCARLIKPFPLVLHIKTLATLMMAWRFVVTATSGPILWLLYGLNRQTPVYWLCTRLVRPCPCMHKTRGMGVNISMPCGSAYHNVHNTEDGMVVL